MLDVVENLSVTSEENAFSSIVPTWIESDFLKGSMWLGRSHQRVGNKYFLASRKLGKIADLTGKETGYSKNCLDHSVTALENRTVD